MIETTSSIAGERMPHGSPVRIVGRECFVEADNDLVDGVTKRPWVTDVTFHEKGEALQIQTSGGIKAERAGVGLWIVLHRGRVTHVA